MSDPGDFLDGGICDGPDAPRGEATDDADVAALVLFAGVAWDDPDAVAAHQAKWEALHRGA